MGFVPAQKVTQFDRWFDRVLMKDLVIAVIFAACLLWIHTTAEAVWLIDAERFHVSVHGQLSCRDCHEDINEKKFHPAPANVNKALSARFTLSTGLARNLGDAQ
jgi:hypothetical protein